MPDIAQQLRDEWDAHMRNGCPVAIYRLAAEEIDRLRAIVDQYPKTADGVSVVPGMVLWRRSFGKSHRMEVVSLDDLSSDWPVTVRMSSHDGGSSTYRWHVQACYSTRGTAEEAD